MADPISPLAAFGLAMAILNFLLTTAEKLHSRYHELKDYADTLHAYEGTVFGCVQTYNIWIKYYGRTDEQSYKDLFERDWTVIKSTKQLVEKYIRELVDLLRLKVDTSVMDDENASLASWKSTLRQRVRSTKEVDSSRPKGKKTVLSRFRSSQPGTLSTRNLRHIPKALAPGDLESWDSFTDSFSDAISENEPEEEVLRRIVGLLGPNLNLKTKVTELEKVTANLSTLTKNAFRRAGHGEEPKHAREVETALDTAVFRRLARVLATQFRSQLTGDETSDPCWFLELQLPPNSETELKAVTTILRECRISFMTRGTALGQRHLQVAKLIGRVADEASDVSDLATTIGGLLAARNINAAGSFEIEDNTKFSLDSSSAPRYFTKDWRKLLVACADDDFKQAFELERARLALGLSLWVILFWETEWFTHVCSCAFRCVVSTGEEPRSEQVYAMPSQSAVVVSPAPPGINQPQVQEGPKSCRGQTAWRDRLYHLGILLSELALGMPIRLTSDLDHEPREARGIPTDPFHGTRQIKGHPDLPLRIRDAINFCFDNSGKDQTKWTVDNKTLAAEKLEDFIEGVLKPIREYHDEVEKGFTAPRVRQFVKFIQDEQYVDQELST